MNACEAIERQAFSTVRRIVAERIRDDAESTGIMSIVGDPWDWSIEKLSIGGVVNNINIVDGAIYESIANKISSKHGETLCNLLK